MWTFLLEEFKLLELKVSLEPREVPIIVGFKSL